MEAKLNMLCNKYREEYMEYINNIKSNVNIIDFLHIIDKLNSNEYLLIKNDGLDKKIHDEFNNKLEDDVEDMKKKIKSTNDKIVELLQLFNKYLELEK
jgi:hypothetical protein